MSEVHGPLMGDRGLEVFFYGVTAYPANECLHIEVVKKGRVDRLALHTKVIDDCRVARRCFSHDWLEELKTEKVGSCNPNSDPEEVYLPL